ncbi:MAG: YeeE/YedE thiosulfate transporter family protein [Rhodoferax sp.]
MSDVISGLVCGLLFGFVLESAGFGSPLKLTAQFSLRDWSVFKVMFTAIVVAAAGLWLGQVMGWLQADAVFVPPAMLLAAAVGGVFIGAGFAVGGYCPGTSVVGLFSGRLDALVFLVGLILGTFAFAGLYGPAVESLMALGELESADALSDWLGVGQGWVVIGLMVALVMVFYAGSWFERRSAGPVSAEQAVAGAQAEEG